MNFLNRTLSFLVERLENEFATPSNRWSGEKVNNFRSENLQMNSNWTVSYGLYFDQICS